MNAPSLRLLGADRQTSPELKLVTAPADDIKWNPADFPPEVAYWAPVVEDLAARLTTDPKGAEPLLELALNAQRLRDKSTQISNAAFIECLSLHPDVRVQRIAAEFVYTVVEAGDEAQTFRVARRLFENDENAEEAMLTLMINPTTLPASGLKKVYDALTTRWYERSQGLHEQLEQLRVNSL